MLERWRAIPAPELAELLDATLTSAPPNELPRKQAEWLARAAAVSDDPRELRALLESMVSRRLVEGRERVLALRRLLPDPRVAHALFAVVEAVPFTSDSSLPFFRAVFDVLGEAGDPRVLGWLPRARENLSVREGFRAPFLHLLDALEARMKSLFPEGAPSLDAESLAALPAKPAALAPPPRDEATLFAAVYADPDDDAPRLVLADLLQERGDPRGELIALQCRGGQERRVAALLKKHGKEWLGELAPYLGSGFVFRRGFLSRATLKLKNGMEAKRAQELPAFATLERIDVGACHPTPPRTLRALRELHGISEYWLPGLAALPHLRLRAMSFQSLHQRSEWDEFQSSFVIAELEELAGVPASWIAPHVVARLKRLRTSGLEEAHLEAVRANPALAIETAVEHHYGLRFEARIARVDGLLELELRVPDVAATPELWQNQTPETLRSWMLQRTGYEGQMLTPDLGRHSVQVVRYVCTAQRERTPLEEECAARVRETVAAWASERRALRRVDLRALGGDELVFRPELEVPDAPASRAPTIDPRCRLEVRPTGLFVVQPETCLVLDPRTGALLHEAHTDRHSYATVSGDGRVVVRARDGVRIAPLDGKARFLPGPAMQVTSATASHDGSRLLVLVGDIYSNRRLDVLALDGDEPVVIFSRGGCANGTLTADGGTAILSVGSRLSLCSVDAESKPSLLAEDLVLDRGVRCALSPSGRTLAVQTVAHELVIFDLALGRERARLALPSSAQHRCTDTHAVAATEQGLFLYDLAAGTRRTLLDQPARAATLGEDVVFARIVGALVALSFDGAERFRIACNDGG